MHEWTSQKIGWNETYKEQFYKGAKKRLGLTIYGQSISDLENNPDLQHEKTRKQKAEAAQKTKTKNVHQLRPTGQKSHTLEQPRLPRLKATDNAAENAEAIVWGKGYDQSQIEKSEENE